MKMLREGRVAYVIGKQLMMFAQPSPSFIDGISVLKLFKK
jgi:hypothetical protein